MKQGRWKIIADAGGNVAESARLSGYVCRVEKGGLGGQLAMGRKRWFALRHDWHASFLWFWVGATGGGTPRLRLKHVLNILVGVVMRQPRLPTGAGRRRAYARAFQQKRVV